MKILNSFHGHLIWSDYIAGNEHSVSFYNSKSFSFLQVAVMTKLQRIFSTRLYQHRTEKSKKRSLCYVQDERLPNGLDGANIQGRGKSAMRTTRLHPSRFMDQHMCLILLKMHVSTDPKRWSLNIITYTRKRGILPHARSRQLTLRPLMKHRCQNFFEISRFFRKMKKHFSSPLETPLN